MDKILQVTKEMLLQYWKDSGMRAGINAPLYSSAHGKVSLWLGFFNDCWYTAHLTIIKELRAQDDKYIIIRENLPKFTEQRIDYISPNNNDYPCEAIKVEYIFNRDNIEEVLKLVEKMTERKVMGLQYWRYTSIVDFINDDENYERVLVGEVFFN